MKRYLVKRVGLAFVAIVGSSILIFFIMRVIPGDPVSALLAQAELGLTLEERQAMREQFGLHLPIYQQYLKWVWDVVRLDPGISLVRQTSVASDFGRAFPVTAELTVLSLIMVIALSLVLGPLLRFDRTPGSTMWSVSLRLAAWLSRCSGSVSW